MTTFNMIQLTTAELKDLISDAVKNELEELKKQLQIPKTEKYLTRKEVMQLFKISKGTLSNWVEAGTLTKYGVGGRIYFKSSEIEQTMIKLK